MHPFISELKKINSQYTIPATMLMALRARIEFKRGIPNRIDKSFEKGNKGVLIMGPGGTGKTTTMRALFDGLGLDGCDSEGRTLGKWIPSAGDASAVGICEILEIFNDSTIFLDELNLDSKRHCEILKQVSHGEISRPIHGSVQSKPFTGLVMASSNGIKLPPPDRLSHLLATLERFMLVRVKAPEIAPEDYMDLYLDSDEKKQDPVNWDLIADALVNTNYYDFNIKEKNFIRALWKIKSQEILQTNKAQYRNSQLFADIFTFIKRILSIKDITKDTEAIKFAKDLIDSTVTFNPISILWLRDSEQVIYDLICQQDCISMQEIIGRSEVMGMTNSYRTYSRILEKLVDSRLIYRTSKGKYSIKRIIHTETTSRSTKVNKLAEVI